MNTEKRNAGNETSKAKKYSTVLSASWRTLAAAACLLQQPLSALSVKWALISEYSLLLFAALFQRPSFFVETGALLFGAPTFFAPSPPPSWSFRWECLRQPCKRPAFASKVLQEIECCILLHTKLIYSHCSCLPVWHDTCFRRAFEIWITVKATTCSPSDPLPHEEACWTSLCKLRNMVPLTGIHHRYYHYYCH